MESLLVIMSVVQHNLKIFRRAREKFPMVSCPVRGYERVCGYLARDGLRSRQMWQKCASGKMLSFTSFLLDVITQSDAFKQRKR